MIAGGWGWLNACIVGKHSISSSLPRNDCKGSSSLQHETMQPTWQGVYVCLIWTCRDQLRGFCFQPCLLHGHVEILCVIGRKIKITPCMPFSGRPMVGYNNHANLDQQFVHTLGDMPHEQQRRVWMWRGGWQTFATRGGYMCPIPKVDERSVDSNTFFWDANSEVKLLAIIDRGNYSTMLSQVQTLQTCAGRHVSIFELQTCLR